MQDNEFDLRMKIYKYEEVLNEIASAGEQANPKHLSNVAQRVLTFYSNDGEPTTADELNSRYATNADDVIEQSEIAEYDKKSSEEAESAWRDTVLHPDYKSDHDEICTCDSCTHTRAQCDEEE